MHIARYIDHTALKPETNEVQIQKLCLEAREYGFAAVCVNSMWVGTAKKLLEGSSVGICTVVGFPFGATMLGIKAVEARRAVEERGASEIDMVLNIGALKSGRFSIVKEDIESVRLAARDVTLKVIIETCLLTKEEKIKACEIAKQAGADFVKTSTGFSTGGATVEDVRLIREVVGPHMGVKASGGIKDYPTAKAMIDAGANRLGCSASVAIVLEAQRLLQGAPS